MKNSWSFENGGKFKKILKRNTSRIFMNWIKRHTKWSLDLFNYQLINVLWLLLFMKIFFFCKFFNCVCAVELNCYEESHHKEIKEKKFPNEGRRLMMKVDSVSGPRVINYATHRIIPHTAWCFHKTLFIYIRLPAWVCDHNQSSVLFMWCRIRNLC